MQLMCNYYTLQQDGSRSYIRSWKFQVEMIFNGLSCGGNWKVLYLVMLLLSRHNAIIAMSFLTCLEWQGSMDGKTWTDLRIHENEETVCKPGQFCSWPIVGPNTLLAFQFFRVVLTGPTSDASNPWNFCICFLELYGYFNWCYNVRAATLLSHVLLLRPLYTEDFWVWLYSFWRWKICSAASNWLLKIHGQSQAENNWVSYFLVASDCLKLNRGVFLVSCLLYYAYFNLYILHYTYKIIYTIHAKLVSEILDFIWIISAVK